MLTSYTGSSLNDVTSNTVSYAAWFNILNGGTSNSKLVIKLINNTTGSSNRSDLLSGVFFNLSGVTAAPSSGTGGGGSYANVTTALVSSPDAGKLSQVVNGDNSTPAPSQAVDGSFVFRDLRTISGTQFNYGVNSTGFTNTGGAVQYTFSGFGLGGGDDDYTIRPNNTGAINGSNVVVIKNEVLLTLSGFGSGLTSTTQLSNVYFAVGSGAPQGRTSYVLVKGSQTPEPGSVGLLTGLAITAGFCIRRRRRRSRR